MACADDTNHLKKQGVRKNNNKDEEANKRVLKINENKTKYRVCNRDDYKFVNIKQLN